MWTHRFFVSLAVALLSVFAATFTGRTQTDRRPPAANQSRQSAAALNEDAYRANNLGVALLEQFKYKEAAEEFQRALKLDPAFAIARLNRGIALFNLPDLPAALLEAQAAAKLLPDSPHAHYLLGMIAKGQNRTPDALVAFRRVLQLDPRDPGANINVGQILMSQRDYANAAAAFRTALAEEAYNLTALYNLAMSLTRSGQREEGTNLLQQFQRMRDAGYGTTIGQNYLEQGRYSEAVASTGAEPSLVDAATPEVTFAEATAGAFIGTKSDVREWTPVFPPLQGRPQLQPVIKRSFKTGDWTEATRRDVVARLGGGPTLFDYDSDGDLDLFEVTPFGQRLFKNDAGKFTDVTAASGLTGATPVAIGAVAGDYDNDTRPDLFVLRYGGSALYHNDGNGKFSDVTSAAGIPGFAHLSLSAALVDLDHDGDLDIFIAGFADLTKGTTPSPGSAPDTLTFPDSFAGAPNLLLRNNGNGKFTDITAQSKISGIAHSIAVVPTDYDNRRDVDLLVLNYGAAPALFSNQRDGTFRDVAAEVGLNVNGNFTCVAAGDLNKDSFTDFFFGKDDGGGLFAISNGKGKFVTSAAPANLGVISASQFLDYDDDGLLDLLFFMNSAVGLLRNLGSGWENVSDRAIASNFFGSPTGAAASPVFVAPPVRFATGDVDSDGDTDLLARLPSGEIKFGRNDGGNRQGSLRVRLAGKVSNRSAVGSKVEARSGSLKQKLETYAACPAPAPADLIFGIGKRTGVDAVRVLWPAGILQAETEIARRPATASSAPLAQNLTITELDRKPSSCPYLYTWNGERFEFVTDFMGGGEMGYRVAPATFNTPDPDEYVRIRGDQLKERNGRFELRITNELEEVLYVDRLQLIAVTHPADTEIFPNEGMVEPPRAFKLYTTHHARPPARATDDQGRDVRSRIATIDRTYPDDFALHKIRGYAAEHGLTLDLGEPSKNQTLLLLTGWTDYAFSSDNVAAHQSGLQMMPPALQVKDGRGKWQTVIANIGIPVGRPQTVTVDLTGKFLSPSREVRIVTNMRIYWDQILVDTSSGNFPAQMTRLETHTADLRWRGFSAEITPDGREPFSYDYTQVLATSPWKVLPGRYTREGDVKELLSRTDDRFVIARPGDEIAVSIDATKLPPLPEGWKRTFLLYSDGFSKEMDINSASPDAVAPLPFHGMTGYPYSARESYPNTRAHREYLERYNTRVVAMPVPRIETTMSIKAGALQPGPRPAPR